MWFPSPCSFGSSKMKMDIIRVWWRREKKKKISAGNHHQVFFVLAIQCRCFGVFWREEIHLRTRRIFMMCLFWKKNSFLWFFPSQCCKKNSIHCVKSYFPRWPYLHRAGSFPLFLIVLCVCTTSFYDVVLLRCYMKKRQKLKELLSLSIRCDADSLQKTKDRKKCIEGLKSSEIFMFRK